MATTVAIVGAGRRLDQWLARLEPDPAYQIVAVAGRNDHVQAVAPERLADRVVLHHRAALKHAAPGVLLVLEATSAPEVIRDGLRAGVHVIADLPVAYRANQVPGYLDLSFKQGRRVIVPARRADPGLEVLRAVLADDSPAGRPWAVQVDLLYTEADQPAASALDAAASLLVRAADLAGVRVTALLADQLGMGSVWDKPALYEVPVLSTVADGVVLTVRAGAVPDGARGLTGPAGRWTVTAATGTQYLWLQDEVGVLNAHGLVRHWRAPVVDDTAPAWLDEVLADLHGTGAGRHLLGAEHDRHARVLDALLRSHNTGKPSGVPASQLLDRAALIDSGAGR